MKKSPQLPGAGRARAWHYHGSDMPTSPRAIYVLKSGGSVITQEKKKNKMVGDLWDLPAKKFSQSSLIPLNHWAELAVLFSWHIPNFSQDFSFPGLTPLCN